MGDVDPIGDLKRQHEVLQAEMRGIMEMARELRGEAPQQARQSFGERLVVFRQALDLHCLREEEALFPEARELATAPARSAGAEQADLLSRFLEGEGEDDMRAHSLVSARMEQIRRLLGGEMNDQAVTKLRAVASAAQSLLASHCAKEDTMIFPIIEQALTPDQMRWVWERMQAVRTGSEAERKGAMGMRRLGE